MALDVALVVTGVALLSATAGIVVGTRTERRRMLRQLTDEAQAWLDQRTST